MPNGYILVRPRKDKCMLRVTLLTLVISYSPKSYYWCEGENPRFSCTINKNSLVRIFSSYAKYILKNIIISYHFTKHYFSAPCPWNLPALKAILIPIGIRVSIYSNKGPYIKDVQQKIDNFWTFLSSRSNIVPKFKSPPLPLDVQNAAWILKIVPLTSF